MGRHVTRRAALGLGLACLACGGLAAPLACVDADGEAQPDAAAGAPVQEHRAGRGPHRVLVRAWPDDALHGGLDAATPRLAARAGLDALEAWRAAGFPAPRLAAGTLVIALRNLDGARGGASPSWDHIRVERLLRPGALRETIFHESFHLVQHACNDTPQLLPPADGGMLFTPMVREGGARLMEAMAGATPTRYEEEAERWFLPGPRSLGHWPGGARGTRTGPAYSGGLFWAYAAERCGGAPGRPFAREIRTQRALLEATRRHPGPATAATLRAAVAAMPAPPGDLDRCLYVDGDPALPAGAETLWGDFLLALALNGTAGADSRFRFAAAGGWRGIAGRPGFAQPLAQGEAQEPAALPPFAHHAFRLPLEAREATRLLRLRVQPLEGMGDALVQVAFLDRAGELRDLLRHDAAAAGPLDRVLPLRDLSALLVLVATREAGGRCRVLAEWAPDAPLLAATPWNAQDTRSLTHDPLVRAPDWRSTDIGVTPGLRDAAGPFALVLLSLRNRGTLPAAGIAARAEWRPLAGGAWLPLETHAPPPARLLPDDECRRLLREETTPTGPGTLPCTIDGAALVDPLPTRDRAAATFRFRGPSLRGALLRVTAAAEGDPNGALRVLTSFGGAPPMRPLT